MNIFYFQSLSITFIKSLNSEVLIFLINNKNVTELSFAGLPSAN